MSLVGAVKTKIATQLRSTRSIFCWSSDGISVGSSSGQAPVGVGEYVVGSRVPCEAACVRCHYFSREDASLCCFRCVNPMQGEPESTHAGHSRLQLTHLTVSAASPPSCGRARGKRSERRRATMPSSRKPHRASYLPWPLAPRTAHLSYVHSMFVYSCVFAFENYPGRSSNYASYCIYQVCIYIKLFF
jgi:hypothetical protein